MCAYSMIADHYRTKPDHWWDGPAWKDYQELIRKAKLYDELNKEPNCELQDKIAFEKQVEDLLRKKGIIP